MIPTKARIIPNAIEEKNAEDTRISASSWSLAPRALLVSIPLPIPIVKPIACMIAIIENTMPTAPLALVPS